MATATLSPATKPQATPATPQTPIAAMPAPSNEDEELRKSMEAEAAELEEQEEAVATDEPEPQEEEEDAVSTRLLGAAKEVTSEIEECNKIIEQADADRKAALDKLEAEYAETVDKAKGRREELKSQFQAALNKMQRAYGVAPKTPIARKVSTPAKPSAKTRPSSNGKGKSIRVLILEYLEKHRQAKTHEIRTFLQSQGRTTNPGVELTRMVKSGAIINKERGLYTVGKHK